MNDEPLAAENAELRAEVIRLESICGRLHAQTKAANREICDLSYQSRTTANALDARKEELAETTAENVALREALSKALPKCYRNQGGIRCGIPADHCKDHAACRPIHSMLLTTSPRVAQIGAVLEAAKAQCVAEDALTAARDEEEAQRKAEGGSWLYGNAVALAFKACGEAEERTNEAVHAMEEGE